MEKCANVLCGMKSRAWRSGDSVLLPSTYPCVDSYKVGAKHRRSVLVLGLGLTRSRLHAFSLCQKFQCCNFANLPISLQCKKYRDSITPEKRNILREKLQASEVFKDKKTLYPSTLVVHSYND